MSILLVLASSFSQEPTVSPHTFPRIQYLDSVTKSKYIKFARQEFSLRLFPGLETATSTFMSIYVHRSYFNGYDVDAAKGVE